MSFRAFKAGFLSICSDSMTMQSSPDELEQLICGSKELNFNDLKAVTIYEGGYSADSDVIK